MPKVNVTPGILSRYMSRNGKLGGRSGTHKDKVRAGHAARAKFLRKLAKKATPEEAAVLIQQAEQHEKKAA